MTVTANTTRNDYVGNGQSVYSYTFQLNDASDVTVYLDGVVQTLNTHYTVENVGVGSGGTITFTLVDANNNPIHPSASNVISIAMEMDLDRDTNYQQSGLFAASDVNNDFDRLWLAANQQQTRLGRSIHIANNDLDRNMFLPLYNQRADKVLAFDSNGNLIVGPLVSDTNTIAGISSDISTVAGISANVTTVANIAPNVTTVAGISSDVTTVAGLSASDLGTVATNINSVNTVATNASDVVSVAGKITEVETVADDLDLGANSLVKEVADDLALGNSSLIKEVADNMTDVTNASNLVTATVATGSEGTNVTYDANTGVLTVPRGATGNTGPTGLTGATGDGFTGGSYDPSTGRITFNSDDGLGFFTSDVRGAASTVAGPTGPTGPQGAQGIQGNQGDQGDGFTGASYNANDGTVTFTSIDGLGFQTGDLRGVKGDTGSDGPEGPDGPQGPQGIEGPQGEQGAAGPAGASATAAGSLVYNGSTKLQAYSGGINVSNDVSLPDGGKAKFGASDDLQIYHDGNNSRITDTGTGSLILRGQSSVEIEDVSGENMAVFTSNGAATLYHNNLAKIATTSTGIDVTGDVSLADNGKAKFGASDDLQIWHDGTTSRIRNAVGNLKIQATSNGENAIDITPNGAVGVFYDGIQKLATTNTGIDVTGDISINSSYPRINLNDTNSNPDWSIINANGIINFYDSTNAVNPLKITATGIDVTGTATMDGLTVDGGATTTLKAGGFTSNSVTVLELAENRDGSNNLHYGFKFKTDGAGDNNFHLLRHSNSTTGNKALSVGRDTGDISFYEDTGTTPKFFWDASAESLGIGTTSPDSMLHVRKNQTADTAVEVSNLGTAGASTSASFIVSESEGVPKGWLRRYRDGTARTALGFTDHLVFEGGIGSSPTERMRIDSSGNVRIGTVLPQTSAKFNLRRNGTNIEFGHGNRTSGYYGTLGSQYNNGQPYMGFSCEADDSGNTFTTRGFKGNVLIGTTTGDLTFNQLTSASASGQTPSERMRIDSSGNLLVGKTNTTLGTVGIENRPDGRFTSTRSGNTNLVLNRLASDGSLIDFYKDGTTVGSIGTISSDLTIGSTDTRIRFDDNGAITPRNSSDANSDATIDLGQSGGRFKDLYLSGTVKASGLTYPTSDGTANQVMVTDGSGNLSFASRSLWSSGGLSYIGSSNAVVSQNTPTGNTSTAKLNVFNGNSGITPQGNSTVFFDSSGNNTLQMGTGTYNTAAIYFGNSFGANRAGIEVSQGGGSMAFRNYGFEGMRLNSSGYLGVGTTSPSARITAHGGGSYAGSPSGTLIQGRNTNSDAHAQLVSNNFGSAGIYFGDSSDNDRAGVIYSNYSDRLDFRASGSTKMSIISAGYVGINTTAPQSPLDINGNQLRIRDSFTPSSATATGNKGEICYDSNYMYVCVATNTWKRAALASW